jgi:ATP/ADP translocase
VLAKLLGVGPEDRRGAAVAFATLSLMLAAHAMLETARDALFLAKLPAERLPFAYLTIAVCALGVSKVNEAATARLSRSRVLRLSLLLAAVATASLWRFTGDGSTTALFALYVWTGLIATVLVMQFWLRIGDVFDVTRAKRLFSVIAAGGVAGAAVGSAGAGGLLLLFDNPRVLLPAAALLFVLAALLPFGARTAPAEGEVKARTVTRRSRGALGLVASDAYLVRLFFMVLLGALLTTGVDYFFKARVAEAAQREGFALGPFFARYYAIINALALAVQLFVVPRMLRAVGVSRALLALPLLLLLGAAGSLLLPGLLLALLLKFADGGLRHSVHRTATEILYLPLARQLRERFKALAETLGQRGGQAVGALLLLGAGTMTVEARHLAAGLTVVAGLWVWSVVGLESQYLELFRQQLREGTLETEVDVPNLDLASFELLVAALSAEDDREVIAALEMFDAYGKTDLVPALILYHPSREVVLRAFDLFDHSGRSDVRRLTERLLRHEDGEVRAAALRALAKGDPPEELLRRYARSQSPAMRVSAVTGLLRSGAMSDDEAAQELRGMLDGGNEESLLALAHGLEDLPGERFVWLAEELVAKNQPPLSALVAHSLAQKAHESHVPLLLTLLATRAARDAARRALVTLGEATLDRLAAALGDERWPRRVRTHLPRTISRFRGPRAAALLVAALAKERDETVVFKILRGLGRMRAERPDLPVDRSTLLDLAHATLEHAVLLLHWRISIGSYAALRNATTPATELLVAFIDEREQAAVERVFRMLHIIEPRQEYRLIYDGLKSDDGKARASSRELLSHLAPTRLRDGLLALVEDPSPRRKLRAALEFHDPPGRGELASALEQARRGDEAAHRHLDRAYGAELRKLLKEPNDALRSLVSYHAAELGLRELRLDATQAARDSRSMSEVALGTLRLYEPELSGAE